MGGNRTLPLGLLHVVKDLAGYLGGTYMIGPVRQRLLDVLYFVPSRLIHRVVHGSNMVQSTSRLQVVTFSVTWAADRIGSSWKPTRHGAIELCPRSPRRQELHNWLDPQGWREGGIARQREAEKCWIRYRPAAV